MNYRLATVVAGAVAAVLFASGLSFAQKQLDKGKASEVVKWDLKALNQEPFKLIKATPSPQGNEVRFLVELTRSPTLREQFNWGQRGLFLFRFLDEDGVAITTVQPREQGEFIPAKGTRIWVVLPMPSEQVLQRTWSVVAEPASAGWGEPLPGSNTR